MDLELQYQQTLEYLYTFVDYSLTRGLWSMPEKFDLDRMRVFMQHLGNPERAYPIIHVAGTKGKGSVSALCASALQAAGYRVGLYTSPHLQDYAERIQVDGQPIPHQVLIDLVEQIRPYLDQGTQLTTFEITTALAFWYFALQQVDAVVAEVGLGGRLDATNIVTPVVSVITSISLDHMQILGNSLAEIAVEKGGIIKPGVPVVISPQAEAARQVFEALTRERGSLMIQVGRDTHYKVLEDTLEGQSIQVWQEQEVEGCPGMQGKLIDGAFALRIPLLGTHQVENAATALAALQVACRSGLPLDLAHIQQGFANVQWPGRFEVLRRHPPLVIDAAHNRDSARRLRQAVDKYFPGWKIILVFGASEDKDIDGMLEELIHPQTSNDGEDGQHTEGGLVETVIFTRSYHPRAIDPDELSEKLDSLKIEGYRRLTIPAVEDALEKALALAGEDRLVLVTGSIFIAAGARHSWYNR